MSKLLNMFKNNWFFIAIAVGILFLIAFVVMNIKWIIIGVISIAGGIFLYNLIKSYFVKK